MRRRAAELAQRRAELLAHSAAQREQLILQVQQIAGRLHRVDTRIDSVRRFLGRPWLLLGATAAVVWLLGPRKLMRMGTRGATWVGAVRRVTRLMARVRPHLQQLANLR